MGPGWRAIKTSRSSGESRSGDAFEVAQTFCGSPLSSAAVQCMKLPISVERMQSRQCEM